MSTDVTVRRHDARTAVLDVRGELTADSAEPLTAAYTSADLPGTACIILNFTQLEYMNSGGLGSLVTLLVRANRRAQQVIAYGLSEHYVQILRVTRLDEAIRVAPDEAAAVAAVGS